VISDWKYHDLCVEISSLGYNKEEPEPIERERSIVWQKVLRSLWAEKTTQRHIAAQLALPEDEVNGLIFGVVVEDRQPERGTALSLVKSEISA
jgi:hypothetical protein